MLSIRTRSAISQKTEEILSKKPRKQPPTSINIPEDLLNRFRLAKVGRKPKVTFTLAMNELLKWWLDTGAPDLADLPRSPLQASKKKPDIGMPSLDNEMRTLLAMLQAVRAEGTPDQYHWLVGNIVTFLHAIRGERGEFHPVDLGAQPLPAPRTFPSKDIQAEEKISLQESLPADILDSQIISEIEQQLQRLLPRRSEQAYRILRAGVEAAYWTAVSELEQGIDVASELRARQNAPDEHEDQEIRDQGSSSTEQAGEDNGGHTPNPGHKARAS